MTTARPRTRIQRKNTGVILDAALQVFSRHGFRGATLDEIAEVAGLSKPNLLYYFPSKEAIHVALLTGLMDTWLDPLRDLDPAGDPVEEIMAYVTRKLELSRDYPRESRLFANEIIQGAPRMQEVILQELKPLVDAKAGIIADWIAQGRIAPLDPHHLIFSIWAMTQHYADFDMQLQLVLGPRYDTRFETANGFLTTMILRALRPDGLSAPLSQ